MKTRYISRLETNLSPLGFGVFRLPMVGNDFPQSVYELLHQAMEKGINYYDTAWPYLQGKAESLINKVLVQNYSRDKFHIADKMPVWEIKNRKDMERIFNIQIERLGVEYIDFYLLHAMNRERWDSVYPLGVLDFLNEKKKEGRIRKVGFSFHDTPDVFSDIFKAYDWDFAQLQINYLDWEFRNIKACYEMMVKRDVPCMVMEPLRGGTLSKMPADMEAEFKKIHGDWSMSAWGLRFVANLPNVAVTLSGMNAEEQLNENIDTFSDLREFTADEKEAIDKVAEMMLSRQEVPCTGCGYCLSECPKHIAIPDVLQGYNESKIYKNIIWYFDKYDNFLMQKNSSEMCIKCKLCTKQCPQKINIPFFMEKINGLISQYNFGVAFDRLQQILHSDKTIVLYGAGGDGMRGIRFLKNLNYNKEIIFCDSSPKRWGEKIFDSVIISPSQLKNMTMVQNVAILISTHTHRENVRRKLLDLGLIELIV